MIELLAVVSSALFGVLLARSKRMDMVGVCCVAFAVSFGGGTLRDVLLDRRPLFWIQSEHYAWIVFGIALVGSLLPRLPSRLSRWLEVPDAMGLGLFSVLGVVAALAQGLTPFIAALFGVITGTFGGVMADVLCNEIPSLFRPALPLYASCSFAGCWVYLGARWLGLDEAICRWSAVAVIVSLRLAALRWSWSLPAPKE